MSGKVASGSDATNKYSIDGFIGSEGQIKYTNKSSMARQAAPAPDSQPGLPPHMGGGAAEPHNMDSLEPDSVQPSTGKQLSRMQNQQII